MQANNNQTGEGSNAPRTRDVIAQCARPAAVLCLLTAMQELNWAAQATLDVERQRHLSSARRNLTALNLQGLV
jgi:hypothetical protein